MGPTRRRARDPLPVRGGVWRRRTADGRVGLCAARDVATVWCAANRRNWGARRVVVARGGAEPGGRALWRCVPRACCELA